MKKILCLLLSMLMTLTLINGCSNKATEHEDSEKAITIIYTNDTHTYINNQITKDDGTTVAGLSFSNVKALKDDLVAEGKRVILIDDGDEVQGTAYGSYDKGQSIISIMNATGYDLATFGNHEYDYGFEQFEKNIASADFDYVCSNFYNIQTNDPYTDAYKIIDVDGVKVGFIGITTPDTINDTATATFEDTNGDRLYSFIGYDDKQDLYDLVQKKVDEIKDQVDYVVAIGHLGVDITSTLTSYEVIENTNGINLFIDGHSHTVMESETVKNNKDEDVILTQTGSYLANIGVATLSKTDGISTSLISEYENYDEDVQALEDELINEIEISMGNVIGQNECDLTIYENGTRIVRSEETAISDFVADSYYYYMNEVKGIDCDIAIINGGGVRTDISTGLVTVLDINNVSPFGNTLMIGKIKGSDLKTYLNHCYDDYGILNDDGTRAEMSDSLFTAGLKFEVNANSEEKVNNIEVYNKETGSYEPLDENATYSIAGSDYLLQNKTELFPELVDMEVVATYVTVDYMATVEYVKAFAESDGVPTIATANSPLRKYPNYLMDYENYLGSGRIIEVD